MRPDVSPLLRDLLLQLQHLRRVLGLRLPHHYRALPDPLHQMNISSLPKDELISHTAEIITSQDSRISTLNSEVRVLQVIASILLTTTFLF